MVYSYFCSQITPMPYDLLLFTQLTMRLSTYTLLALVVMCSHALLANGYTPSSRRTFLTRAVTAGATFVAATKPADATEEQQKPSANDKEAEKRRKAQEKEAQRQAEETKKRLAVGRIGTI